MQSYPGDTNLVSYMDNLKERMRYIRGLFEKVRDNPLILIRRFWFPGFFNQKNLLTTLVQDVARRQNVSFESLMMTYRILDEKEKPLTDLQAEKKSIYYVTGLYLFGAKWNHQSKAIVELFPEEPLGSIIPFIEVKIRTVDQI